MDAGQVTEKGYAHGLLLIRHASAWSALFRHSSSEKKHIDELVTKFSKILTQVG